jgi:hypothetical protein
VPSSSAAWVGRALILSGDDRGAKPNMDGTDNIRVTAKRASMVRGSLDCSLLQFAALFG